VSVHAVVVFGVDDI